MLDSPATRGAHCRSENPQKGKGESERGVCAKTEQERGVCAKSERGVCKAKPRAESWTLTIQSSVLVDEERGRQCFWGHWAL